jgi:predicted amidohydrolase
MLHDLLKKVGRASCPPLCSNARIKAAAGKMPALLFLAVVFCTAAAEPEPTLTVAAVQMRSSRDLQTNVESIASRIRTCASNGADVVVFPECALSGYFEDVVTHLSSEQLAKAEDALAQVCKDAGVYAIVGTPSRVDGKVFNSAIVISPERGVIERYHKIQLAEDWPEAGEHLSVFKIRGIPCSIIICHDERYPELVRLPVLAGAQVIFYVSHESGLREEHKIGPYRAQIQARAVENNVYVVHANAPANKDTTGSHGHSRIIAPDGNIVSEASIFGEEVLRAKLDIRKATRSNARNSVKRGPLRDWWEAGIKKVRIIE